MPGDDDDPGRRRRARQPHVAPGQYRGQSPDYRAVREALVDLLVHQDYSNPNRTARILWFSDRTIFENPGDSLVSLPEMLDGGSSQRRNPRLTRMMRQAGFAEQAGTGIPSIVRTWRAAGRIPPAITNDRARRSYRLELSVSPDAGRLLTYARERGELDRSVGRLVTGLSGRDVEALLANLVTKHLLTTPEDEAFLSRDEKILLAIRRRPGIRVPQLARALGWSPATVWRSLEPLRDRRPDHVPRRAEDRGFRAGTGSMPRPLRDISHSPRQTFRPTSVPRSEVFAKEPRTR